MHTRFLQGDVRQNYGKQIMIMNILKTDNYISEKLEIKPMTATALNKIGGSNYSVMVWCYPESTKYEDFVNLISFDGYCCTLSEFMSYLQQFSEEANAQIIISATKEKGDPNCGFEVVGTNIRGTFIITNNKENPKILHAIADTMRGSRITVQ